MRGYTLPAGKVQISFSGGRTSAYMLHQILAVNGPFDPDRVQVIFSNTGREMPETLDFVQEVSERWGVHIVWVEGRPYNEAGDRFEIVSHNSASRNGEPFEQMIRRKKYLPNQQARFCTAELKVRPARDYLRSIGWDHWKAALGIRADEPRRINRDHQKERWQRWYPLADCQIDKHIVMNFWENQPFDLGLDVVRGNSALGNCDGCFLKSEAHLAMLARDYPDRHKWWQEMEALASSLTASVNGARFRKEFTRAELGSYVDRQGDWIFDDEHGALCQASGGECAG
jgi:3'-phosphoadenosine 5'-phosphosulfate sulfotransferase (PAPS reductase)/FAD synthetase